MKLEPKARTQYLSFISPSMLFQSAVATGIAGSVYIGHASLKFPMTEGVARMVHVVTGILLGILLIARVVMGAYLVNAATSNVYKFTKACRSLAVHSTSVTEPLTVAAGAEIEKKAVSKFRYELVRLLNLAFYCYSLTLQGMRLAVPPTPLRAGKDAKSEDEVLSAVENPTVMVAKMIASLLEQQRAAKRISNEQVRQHARQQHITHILQTHTLWLSCPLTHTSLTSRQVGVLMGIVNELIDAYHSSLALLLSPGPVSMSAFTYFFTAAWAYYTGAALAVIELGDSVEFETFGLGLTLVYTAFLSLFIFGLYEAGNIVEAPIKATMALLVTEDISHTLSDDLASLIDDDTVPVFLPK